MRLQIDRETCRHLDALRKSHPEITGGGHLPTIRWLLAYHHAAGDLVKIKEDIEHMTADVLQNLPTWFQASIQEALKNVFTNALAAFLPAAFRRTAGAPDSPENHTREGRQQYEPPPPGHNQARIEGTRTVRYRRRT